LIGALFGLFSVIVVGLVWFFIGAGASSPVGFGWYLFSFAAGLSMIVLPCTLPLAFIIVPLSMGKGPAKGFAIAIAFGVGVAATLSMYGILAAVAGKVAIGTLNAPLETVKNWLYFIAGLFAYLFALGELGLIKFHMPSYSGAFPPFIQKQKDVLKALLLGLFLGNIGVGCPHPATPVLLTRIAVSGDVFYGWLLFFVHAIGRILPLLLLAILGILGVNALQGLMKKKDAISRATGWGMVFVAGFILVLGLFSHDWWVLSGQHTYLEELTQEGRFLEIISGRLKVTVPHKHGLPPPDHRGLFGLPLALGTWVLLILWIAPLFWYYRIRKKAIAAMADSQEKETAKKILPYLFWNFVTLSLLLIVTFGYALPTRFLHQAQAHTEEEMMPHDEGAHAVERHGVHGKTLYHESSEVKEGLNVTLALSPQAETGTIAVGTPTLLTFFVKDEPEGIPITDLQIEHEKYMHIIGVRDDLNEFFHLHPEPVLSEDGKTPEPGMWSVRHTFVKPGTYKVWTDVAWRGENHSIGHPVFHVEGEGPRSEKQINFGTNVIVGEYQVALEYDSPIPAREEREISFDIHDLFGNEVEVEPYLAADMHLTVIKDDLKQYIHTHPDGGRHASYGKSQIANRLIEKALAHGGEEAPGVVTDNGSSDEHINFHITFPEPGIYKLFAQFRPKGINLPPDEALTASFYVKVEKAQAFSGGLTPWWRNLIVSLALIAALSWAVKKYITVNVKAVSGQ